MKKFYNRPELETLLWDNDDVITTSGDTVEDLPVSGEDEDGIGAF